MRILIVFTGAWLALSCTTPESSRLVADGSDLVIGEAKQGTLPKHGADTFRVNLRESTFVHGYANQLTADVEIHIYGPDKNEMNSYDESGRGKDFFFFTTKEAGIYLLIIKPFREEAGNFELVISNAVALAKEPTDRVDQIVSSFVEPDAPGASIAVVKDSKIIYSKGFGLANLEYNLPNTPQTIFHIASVSKQFTGFAIAMLADQGKVSMNDDIRKYIPELHDFGTPITLSQLVHHTSGLRDQWNLLAMAGWRLDDVITREQIIRLISRQRELNFNPGDEMVYCNTGFTLLAEVVSRVTGQSFSEWTKENIFQPLEMNNTLFYDDHEKVVPNRAYSYHVQDTVVKKSVLSYANVGATSLFTTVEDLSKWAMNFESMSVGNERVMKMMEERYILNKGDTMSYGYGQAVGMHKGLTTWSHGGADAGYRTMLLRFPDQHFSVAVFSNLASFNPGGLAYTIADNFLADSFKEQPDNVEEESNEPPKKEEAFDATKVGLAEFAGRFYSEELETFYDFDVVKDTLTGHHQRHDDFKLTPKATDAFDTNVWWMGEITFTRDASGNVNGLLANSGRVRNLKFRKVKGMTFY